jgi:fucose permease
MAFDRLSPHQARLATIACYLTFLVIGMGGTLLGPTLGNWAGRFGVPLQNAGIFPSLVSLGIVFGVLLSGWLLDRLNARIVLIGGALIISAGLWGFNFAGSLTTALAAAATFGVGFGALSVSSNVVVAVLNPVNTSAAVNTLNAVFGIGAIVGPQVVNFAFSQNDYTLAYRLAGSLALALSVPLLAVSVHTHTPSAIPPGTQRRRHLPWLALLPFAALLFIYVGSESGFGSWVSTQMERVALSTAATATVATSLFWAGLTTGRALASLGLRRLTNYQVISGALIVVGIGAAFFLFGGRNETVGLSASFLVGLGCGPVFPTAFTVASGLYPEARGTLSGLLIATGAIGGVIIPWLQGQIGSGRDGGMSLTLVAALAMLALVHAVGHRATIEAKATASI